jgi:Alpha amylase, catalytic domain/Maltogenic Amylase, C-terminal domain
LIGWSLIGMILFAGSCTAAGTGGAQRAPRNEEAGSRDLPAENAKSSVTAGDFLELNGWVWFYTTASEIRFDEITAMMDDLHRRGIRVIGIYSPYNGNPDKWLGCAPLDFYDVAPQSGTLGDFKKLVSAAHRRGMKVVTYFVNIYIDHESDFFRAAEKQYAAGDRTSREVSAFRWSEDVQAELPEPAAGPSDWRYSEVAGAYYWSLWGEAGLDHTLPGARAELARVEKFWLDTGIDGFMWDAAFVDPIFSELMVELPLKYTPNDKWITFESTVGEEARSYYEFGLTSWFNFADDDATNDYSRVAVEKRGADDLEEALAQSDAARSAGRLTHAWSPWGVPRYPDNDRMLVQEAALLAGAGIAYGAPSYTALSAWPETARANWERVMTAVNENPALLPSASRSRLPAGDNPNVYSMIRSAEKGSQTVLLVYNFMNKPAEVPVDLTGTDVLENQTPTDLYGDATFPEISGSTYRVELPAYGFAILEVNVS